MKQKFSKKWKSSKQPRKQRKFLANAPLHIRRKFLSVNLSKELRKKHEKRNLVLRKNDKVKIMRGKFKGKTGKVLEIDTKKTRAYIEGIQIKKLDGSKANVPIKTSNLQITELDLEDKKRIREKTKNKQGITNKAEKSKIETTKKPVQKDKNKEKKK